MKKDNWAWLPAILLMVVIFIYSSMPAVESSQRSMMITDVIVDIYENISDQSLDETLKQDWKASLEHNIRKAAHITEYTFLALAMALPFWMKGRRALPLFTQAVLLTVAYAITDELHQRLVPGRSGELRDVLIDALGAILGASIFIMVTHFASHKKQGD